MQFNKANVSFTSKCHTLQAHQVTKTGKQLLWWRSAIALEKADEKPTFSSEHRLPLSFLPIYFIDIN